MASHSKVTDDTICKFMLTLPRALRSQLKQVLVEMEIDKGFTVYPNTTLKYLLDKFLGNPINLEDRVIAALEERFNAVIYASGKPATGSDGQDGEAAGEAGVPAGGTEETGSPRRPRRS